MQWFKYFAMANQICLEDFFMYMVKSLVIIRQNLRISNYWIFNFMITYVSLTLKSGAVTVWMQYVGN